MINVSKMNFDSELYESEVVFQTQRMPFIFRVHFIQVFGCEV